jgi:N-carbamoylputrescine amidase
MKDTRIAAVIFHSPLKNVAQNLQRMEEWIRAAKKQQAAIVCFPEMNICGYSIRGDSLESDDEPRSGSVAKKLQKLARENEICILAGMAEKGAADRLYASHLVATPEKLAGSYRKLHIAPPERHIFAAGTQVTLFKFNDLSFAIQLCYDAHFPELTTRMALEGADVLFIPHASPRGTPQEKFDSWLRHLPARAYDNGLYLVACNQTGDNQEGLKFPGVAMVVNPLGRVIAQKKGMQEGILFADLKAAELKAVRQHPMRYFLPNRRPDIYQTE